MPEAAFILRPANPKDIPRIRQLAGETWRVSYPGIISTGQIDYMLGWMYAPEKLAEEISGGKVWYGMLVVQDAGEVGYIAFGPGESEGEAHLHKLYVHPDFQGRGLGLAALSQVLRLATEQGYQRMSLRVNRANEAGIHCYRKAGFEVEREVCSDIGAGFVMDDSWMVRQLG